jgi:PST family polysaccharide transporter
MPAPAPDLAVETSTHGLKQRSVRGAAATLVSQGLRVGLQFGSQIVLARLLSPGDFGLIAMVAPLLVLVQIFNELGLSQATIQRAEISHAELSQLFWINTAASVALALVMALCAPLVVWFYGEPTLSGICVALAGLLVLSGLSAQQIALMNRRMRFTALALIDVACAVLAVVAGITAALLGCGLWSLVLMQAANSMTILAMSWLLSDWRPGWPRGVSGVGQLLRFGGHLTAANLVNYAGTNLDSVLIGRIGGSVALGLYDRAFKLVAAPIWQISLPVARVAVALLSRLHGSDARYRHAYLRMLQMLLVVTTPAVIWTAMTAPVVVPLLLGAPWVAAAPIVSALAIATAFAPLSISASWLFVSQNRVGEQLRYVVLKALLAIASLLAGLPWGALGVAQSAALFGLLVHGSQLWGAARIGPVSRGDILRALGPVVIAAAAAAAGLALFEHAIAGASWPVGAVLPAGAALAYVAFGAALLVTGEGRHVLRDIVGLRRLTRGATPADSRA